jgi:hypothetical protein
MSGALRKTIHVPCRGPRICVASADAAWVVGAAASIPDRHDLFRIDLVRATCTIETAMLDSSGWGRLDAARFSAGWMLAYATHGVFWLEDGVELALLLPDGDEIVELCHDDKIGVVVTQGKSGPCVVIGGQQLQVVELPEAPWRPMLESIW